MGFWSNVLGYAPHVLSTPRRTTLGRGGVEPGGQLLLSPDEDPSSWSASTFWRRQPHLRTVVSFRARNAAQLGLHVFERVDDTDRRRDRESRAARALARPDEMMTLYDTLFALVGDLDLHDRAYWLITKDRDTGRDIIRRLPPAWVSPVWRDPWEVKHYDVALGERTAKIDPSEVIAFTGYSPDSVIGCSPTVESLRDTLKEQIEAAGYRRQVWKSGGRVSSVIERPANARQWSDEAMRRFIDDWYAKFTGQGEKAGGTPVLEDGMQLKQVGMSTKDQQYVEAAHLSLQTVAAAYHVQPVMVGQTEGSSYSNVREFRRMLYGDTLGPLLKQIEDVINARLLPILGMDPERFYVEFNVESKLEGSFQEKASVLQTMTGRPVMTLNEGRSKLNLPALEDGDEVITPMNVTEGGQASPTDSGSQNDEGGDNNNDTRYRSQSVRVKAGTSKRHREQVESVLKATFRRQRADVTSKVGSGSDWWNAERWDRELADDLQKISSDITVEVASDVLSDMGESPSAFDVGRTVNYLRQRSEGSASDINAATRDQVEAALSGGGGTDAVESTFDAAENQRAPAGAQAAAASLAGFATVEAARQRSPGARKRWVTTSGNPRDTHAAMNGQTVPIDEPFSNGLMWPGGLGAGADEVAGCQCEIDVIPGGG